MNSQLLQLPTSSSSSTTPPPPLSSPHHFRTSNNSSSLLFLCSCKTSNSNSNSSNIVISSLSSFNAVNHRRRPIQVAARVVGNDDTGVGPITTTAFEEDKDEDEDEDEEEEDDVEPTADDLEYVSQIKRVLEQLKKNRDMLYGEVKLTIAIEDPRDVERKRLQGIDESDGPSREDLVNALEEVNNGKVPRDRLALRMLAEEMINWPNLEAEAPKKTKTKSLYAKATDTGVDPKVAAKRLNIDWDSAAEIEEAESNDDSEVPPAVGYGALYLVTAFPVIIGISVVLILFYNSLQ